MASSKNSLLYIFSAAAASGIASQFIDWYSNREVSTPKATQTHHYNDRLYSTNS